MIDVPDDFDWSTIDDATLCEVGELVCEGALDEDLPLDARVVYGQLARAAIREWRRRCDTPARRRYLAERRAFAELVADYDEDGTEEGSLVDDVETVLVEGEVELALDAFYAKTLAEPPS